MTSLESLVQSGCSSASVANATCEAVGEVGGENPHGTAAAPLPARRLEGRSAAENRFDEDPQHVVLGDIRSWRRSKTHSKKFEGKRHRNRRANWPFKATQRSIRRLAAARAAQCHLARRSGPARCRAQRHAALQRRGFISSTLTRLPLGAWGSGMPACSGWIWTSALTMIVPSGVADQTRRVPGLACTKPGYRPGRSFALRGDGGLCHVGSLRRTIL